MVEGGVRLAAGWAVYDRVTIKAPPFFPFPSTFDGCDRTIVPQKPIAGRDSSTGRGEDGAEKSFVGSEPRERHPRGGCVSCRL